MHRAEPENQFAQRIREVEDHFSGHQKVVLKNFQTDVCNIEQHYQSKIAALTQCHAADRMEREAELETTTQETEQQRKLLQEALQLEKETIVTKLAEQKKLEHSHTVDLNALMKRNLQLHIELENIISSRQKKGTQVWHALTELHNRLQENLKEKDTLLVQTQNKAIKKLELLLRQAVDDLAQERKKFQSHLFELERQQAETLSFAEKQQQERHDLVTEQKEQRGKIEEMEHHLYQAVEDFHNECLELQGTVAELEEKLKNGISIALKQEEQRVALLAERHKLSFKVHQMESQGREAIRCQTMINQIVQDLTLSDLPVEFVSEHQDPSRGGVIVSDIYNNVMAEQSKRLSGLGENSPMVHHEEHERHLSLQEEDSGDLENSQPVRAQVLSGHNNTAGTEKVEDDHFTDADTSNTEELDEPYRYKQLCVDVEERPESITKESSGFPFHNLSVTSTEEMIEHGTDHELLDSSVGARSITENTKSLAVGEFCENSVETSNAVVAFRIINAEDMMRPKGTEIYNRTYSEIAYLHPLNDAEHDQGRQNIELKSATLSKDTVEMADEEVPWWSCDELNPEEVLVKNGTDCPSTEMGQHDSNGARGLKNATITTNTSDPDLLMVKIAQADVSYHEE